MRYSKGEQSGEKAPPLRPQDVGTGTRSERPATAISTSLQKILAKFKNSVSTSTSGTYAPCSGTANGHASRQYHTDEDELMGEPCNHLPPYGKYFIHTQSSRPGGAALLPANAGTHHIISSTIDRQDLISHKRPVRCTSAVIGNVGHKNRHQGSDRQQQQLQQPRQHFIYVDMTFRGGKSASEALVASDAQDAKIFRS
ncbi:hypothetical protein BDZ91DRAFT_762223 [Kalaharituber pfeilii]|nr:hypothetical protein BDZ91DRAFT_762223 [Kalaharituber pfeilii]